MISVTPLLKYGALYSCDMENARLHIFWRGVLPRCLLVLRKCVVLRIPLLEYDVTINAL